MAKMLIISSDLSNATQILNDIVDVKEDSDTISAVESNLFDIQQVTNVSAAEIKNYFSSQYTDGDDIEYPKFPFSIAGLTQQQKNDLTDPAVDHDTTLSIIETITIKDPIE